MKTFVTVVLAIVVATVVAVELGAEAIATRALADRADRHFGAEVTVTSVDRPATFSLVTGRVTGVEVESPRATCDGVELTQIRASADEVALPWGRQSPTNIELSAVLDEAAVRTVLASQLQQVPFEVELSLVDDGVQIALADLPGSLTAAIEVNDGQVRLTPGGSAPEWFGQFGIDLPIDLPRQLSITDIDVQPGQAVVSAQIREVEIGAASATARPSVLAGTDDLYAQAGVGCLDGL